MSGQMSSILGLALGVILVNNLVLGQLLGVGPFLEGSSSLRRSAGTGVAMILVMGLTAAVSWPLNEYLLAPNGLHHLESLAFLLTAALLVEGMELLERKLFPARRKERGDSLALIANCAVMGAVLQNVQNGRGFGESLTYALAGGVGFLLVICLFASLRERLEYGNCPKAFQGFPIALMTAGLLALCFSGFSSLTLLG